MNDRTVLRQIAITLLVKQAGPWSTSVRGSQQRWPNDTHAWQKEAAKGPDDSSHTLLATTFRQPFRCTTIPSTSPRSSRVWHASQTRGRVPRVPATRFLTRRCFTQRVVDRKAITGASFRGTSTSTFLIRKRSATSLSPHRWALVTNGSVRGHLDWKRRKQLMDHHTAVHIVGGAARRLLGPHIFQAGSHLTVESVVWTSYTITD